MRLLAERGRFCGFILSSHYAKGENDSRARWWPALVHGDLVTGVWSQVRDANP